MNKLKDFISYLVEQVANHSIYVWGAQGQTGSQITESWIRGRETSTANGSRAIKFWKKQVAAGYGDRLRAFDCSGLVMYWLIKEGLASKDMTAAGLYGQCEKIKRNQLKKGDWVFRHDGKKIYHIGIVVDDQLRVIEAKGRDDGVVKRALDARGSNYWNRYGRPKYFAGEINAEAGSWVVARLLKWKSPKMQGDDIKELQRRLIDGGYIKTTNPPDGVFGPNTAAAVKKFQEARKLTVDGIAGKNTITALGGIWAG